MFQKIKPLPTNEYIHFLKQIIYEFIRSRYVRFYLLQQDVERLEEFLKKYGSQPGKKSMGSTFIFICFR